MKKITIYKIFTNNRGTVYLGKLLAVIGYYDFCKDQTRLLTTIRLVCFVVIDADRTHVRIFFQEHVNPSPLLSAETVFTTIVKIDEARYIYKTIKYIYGDREETCRE